MSARDLSRSLAKAATDAQAAALDSTVTIAARLPIFFGCLTAPTAQGLAEWNRAYAEKVEATMAGALAASAAWQAALIRSAFRPPTPVALATDWLRVLDQAGHPARRRVRANAKRLTRTKAG